MSSTEYAYFSNVSTIFGRAKTALRERDERVAKLLRYREATLLELMGVTGLTKSRIYQIFEKEYGFPAREIDQQTPPRS